MSNAEKDLLRIEIKAANMPLVRAVIGASASVIVAIVLATSVVQQKFNDIHNLQAAQAEIAPKVEHLQGQVAKINGAFGIQDNN